MHTWEMCAIRHIKIGTVHATSEHKHDHSYCHEGHISGPNGCISDEFERLENPKQRNKRTTRISTSKIRSVMETKCLQSRARVKVVLKELVSSAE